MTDRRTWLVGFLGVVVAPVVARTQPLAKVVRIGLLSGSSPTTATSSFSCSKEAVPRLITVAVLSNPTVPIHALDLRELELAVRSVKVQLQVVEAWATVPAVGCLQIPPERRRDLTVRT